MEEHQKASPVSWSKQGELVKNSTSRE